MYQRVKEVQKNAAAYEALDAESKRYVDHTIRDYERKGLDKTEDERKEIQDLLTEIKDLEITFSKNLGEENTTLEFTAQGNLFSFNFQSTLTKELACPV